MTLKDAVLEIGCEEIPSSYIAPALEQMRSAAAKLLEEHRLVPQAIHCYATPRRLTLYFQGLPEMQENIEMEVTGPPVSVVFDAQGVPTRAGEGFAKAQGVAIGDLQKKQTPKGEVVWLVKRVKGRPTPEILSEIFPQILKKIRFPISSFFFDSFFIFPYISDSARCMTQLSGSFSKKAFDSFKAFL